MEDPEPIPRRRQYGWTAHRGSTFCFPGVLETSGLDCWIEKNPIKKKLGGNFEFRNGGPPTPPKLLKFRFFDFSKKTVPRISFIFKYVIAKGLI